MDNDQDQVRVFTAAAFGASRQRLTAQADLDLATEATARTELLAALGQAEATHEVEVDTARVFVGARGLCVLLEGARLARGRGCRLTVVPSRSLERMARILDLDPHLDLVPGRSAHLDVPHAR